MIFTAYTAPSWLRRWAVYFLRKLPSFPDEEGGFRTDVAFAAFGILRSGDIKGFEEIVAAYPFHERWNGMSPWLTVFLSESGWRVGSHCAASRFGRACLPEITIPDEMRRCCMRGKYATF